MFRSGCASENYDAGTLKHGAFGFARGAVSRHVALATTLVQQSYNVLFHISYGLKNHGEVKCLLGSIRAFVSPS